jgi:hypothetical protein
VACLLTPVVPGGAASVIKAAKYAQMAESVFEGAFTLIKGIKDRNTNAIIKGGALIGSVLFSVVGGRNRIRAQDYAYFTKYEQIADVMNAAEVVLKGGVVTKDTIKSVKKSLERSTPFNYSEADVNNIINGVAEELTKLK